MKIRTMLKLGAVGAILYYHRRNGGELTLESAKKSLKDLWDFIGKQADAAQAVAKDAAETVEDKAKIVAQKASKSVEASGYKAGNGSR